ncbi:MAG: hypothetical protein ABJM36_02675 [Algibacter sp.]|uniref:hypothetical protein n=1 Tax=Algibacter sp. TaxID=1872428 RepID=UPI003299336C
MLIYSFFYSKHTRSRALLEIDSINFHCDDIGLYTFTKYHNFEYNHVSLTDKVSWGNLLYETFDLTLLTLLSKKEIIIEVVNYDEIFWSGIYKHKKRKFLVKKGVESNQDDLFSKAILNTLHKLLKRPKEEVLFHELITGVFNDFVGQYEKYLKPDKNMLLQILNLYTNKYDWLTFKEGFNMFGPLCTYKIEIEPIYIPKLNMQFKDVKEFQKMSLKGNVQYAQLRRRIREVLEFNNTIRYSLYSRGSTRFDNGINFVIPTNY